ncbi:MAG: FtsX-like permease family protein [Spirochaetales bacterium]|nr:FtsX-like permease family protein [Spirochaetales bacterium]
MELARYVLKNIAKYPFRAVMVILSNTIISFLMILAFSLGMTISRQIKDDVVSKLSGQLKIVKKEDFSFNREDAVSNKKMIKDFIDYFSGNENVLQVLPYYSEWILAQANADRDYIQAYVIDFKNDKRLIDKINILKGGIPAENAQYSCIIDKVTAERFGIDPGDSLVLFIHSVYGARNAMDFVVSGIYAASAPWFEKSVYISHTDYRDLTELSDCFPYYKIYIKDESKIPDMLKGINDEKYHFFVQAYYEDPFTSFLLSLGYSNLLLILGIAVIIFFILLIGMNSILILQIHERRYEIGTLRSLGFPKKTVRKLFLAELLINVTIGFLLGLILIIFVWFLSGSVNIRLPLKMVEYILCMDHLHFEIDPVSVVIPFFLITGLASYFSYRTITKQINRQALTDLLNR